MKRILIHSPYWHTRGGGERYSLTVAACLQDNCDVYLTASSEQITSLSKQMGIQLNRVHSYQDGLTLRNIASFSGVFWVSDGSIPFLPVWKRVIHFQFPLQHINGGSISNAVKMYGASVVCNSIFTKNVIDQEFGVFSSVIYPPVDVEKFCASKKKDKLILSVGRFSTGSQRKRQDILIQAFKKMVDEGLKGWRLMIVGVAENKESETMITAFRSMAKGYPIAIRSDLSYAQLIQLYELATFYWHAAGFGEDLKKYPERAEHFGISTVEAMAAGAIPCSYAAGGQLEIIKNWETGILWKKPDELIEITKMLMNDDLKRKQIQRMAVIRSQDFSKEKFCMKIHKLFV